MPIRRARTEITGESGLLPKFIYLDTDDTTIQITAEGYLESLKNIGIEPNDDWMALVTYYTPAPIVVKRVGLFDVDLVNGKWSLIEYPAGGGGGVPDFPPAEKNRLLYQATGSTSLSASQITRLTSGLGFSTTHPIGAVVGAVPPVTDPAFQGGLWYDTGTTTLKYLKGAVWTALAEGTGGTVGPGNVNTLSKFTPDMNSVGDSRVENPDNLPVYFNLNDGIRLKTISPGEKVLLTGVQFGQVIYENSVLEEGLQMRTVDGGGAWRYLITGFGESALASEFSFPVFNRGGNVVTSDLFRHPASGNMSVFSRPTANTGQFHISRSVNDNQDYIGKLFIIEDSNANSYNLGAEVTIASGVIGSGKIQFHTRGAVNPDWEIRANHHSTSAALVNFKINEGANEVLVIPRDEFRGSKFSKRSGFYMPGSTTAQRTDTTPLTGTEALAQAGQIVYDSTLNEYFYWDGSAWVSMASGGTVGPGTVNYLAKFTPDDSTVLSSTVENSPNDAVTIHQADGLYISTITTPVRDGLTGLSQGQIVNVIPVTGSIGNQVVKNLQWKRMILGEGDAGASSNRSFAHWVDEDELETSVLLEDSFTQQIEVQRSGAAPAWAKTVRGSDLLVVNDGVAANNASIAVVSGATPGTTARVYFGNTTQEVSYVGTNPDTMRMSHALSGQEIVLQNLATVAAEVTTAAGFRISPITTAARLALSDVSGVLATDSDTDKIYFNTGAGWSEPLNPDDNLTGSGSVNKLMLFSAANVGADSDVTQNTNEIVFGRAVGLPSAASDPAGTVEGSIAWRSDSKKLRAYDGTSWVDVGPSAGGGFIDGSGTALKVPRFQDSDTIEDSIITANNARVDAIASGTIPAAIQANATIVAANNAVTTDNSALAAVGGNTGETAVYLAKASDTIPTVIIQYDASAEIFKMGTSVSDQRVEFDTSLGGDSPVLIKGEGGLKIETLSTAQRSGLSAPSLGQLVPDADLSNLFFYDGTAWQDLSLDITPNSIVVGSPTSGNQGAGSINCQACYDDGVLLTDFVFEKYYEGKARDEKHAAYKMKSLEEEVKHSKERMHLSTMPSRDEFESKKMSLGDMATRLWETVETQFLYIKELEERISKLEEKK